MKRRRLKYMISYKEGHYKRTAYAYTKKTAIDKARMYNGRIKKIKGIID